MRLPYVSSILDFIRTVDRLIATIEGTQKSLELLVLDVRDLQRRVTLLEAREELLVEKARTAAATAASAAVTTHLVDLARRIGALEAGGAPRLAPP